MRSSVVVLNRDRLAELRGCIAALTQQTNREFELVLVTNRPDLARDAIPALARAVVVPFTDANVSAARNAGIRAASGDIIAFCDDDALPEPTWLDRLLDAFADPGIGGVGGLVRGRNGVSVQWGPQKVDRAGNDWPLDYDVAHDCVTKTVGTNCAFRREALTDVGGFDEAYRYYLDETDLDWRLLDAGWRLMFTDRAEVHHGTAPGLYRNAERVPRDLYEIGASKAHFCACHCPPDILSEEISGFVHAQRNRLIRAMVHGFLEPGRVDDLLAGLERGLKDGAGRRPVLARFPAAAPERFTVFPHGPAPSNVLLCYGLARRFAGRREARRQAALGYRVTLLEYSLTTLMMRVWFHPDGFWIHRGGTLGRVVRQGSFVRLRTIGAWRQAEENRVAAQRALDGPFQ